MKIFYLFLAFTVATSGCTNKQSYPKLGCEEIARVTGKMSDLMIHDITNPPLAARFFSYAYLAGYEIIAENNKSFKPMHGVINDYPAIKKQDSIRHYSYQLAAVLAMIETAKKMQPSGKLLNAYEQSFLDTCRSRGFDDEVIEQSQKYAVAVSNAILAYAKADRYNRISNFARYTPVEGEGRWYPTPPSYLPAVEPYFNTIRPFFLDSAAQFTVPPPTPYATGKSSAFYKLAYANYTQGENDLSEANRQIALYWDCNPFAVQDDGHLLVGLKKISPGAHWLGITGIVCAQSNKSLDEALLIHAVVAMGLMDSFLACWDEKYRSNRIRPETAIRALIDVHWKPLLQTPPFPEYLSGHSCISATSATILSHYIGSNTAFTDTVEVRFGLPQRRFASFNQAAEEAAISRYYGGIHFMDAIEQGMLQGKKVGALALAKMK